MGGVVFNPTLEHVFSSYPFTTYQHAAPLVSIRQGDQSVCSRLLDLLHLEEGSKQEECAQEEDTHSTLHTSSL